MKHRPVDVSTREKEVVERLEKERESTKERITHPMSRSSSHTASDRIPGNRTRSPPPTIAAVSTPSSPISPKISNAISSANVRPSLSFANVASAKKEKALDKNDEDEGKNTDDPVQQVTDKVADITV